MSYWLPIKKSARNRSFWDWNKAKDLEWKYQISMCLTLKENENPMLEYLFGGSKSIYVMKEFQNKICLNYHHYLYIHMYYINDVF